MWGNVTWSDRFCAIAGFTGSSRNGSRPEGHTGGLWSSFKVMYSSQAVRCGFCKLRRLQLLLRACQIAVEGERVAVQVVEGEFARPPRSKCVLELKLHLKDDRVAAKPDVVRWIGFVSKGQLNAKLLGIEADCPLDGPTLDRPALLIAEL